MFMLPIDLFFLLEKASFKIETKSIGGWKGYISKNIKTGSVFDREYTAFLNMWLEKFIFYGKTVGPTNTNLKLAKTLATSNSIPLGKHLLGSVYHLLHQVSSRLRKNQPITNLRSPWWFIQLWLLMYMHKTMIVELSEIEFPSENFSEEEETITRRCTSFGEAAVMMPMIPRPLALLIFSSPSTMVSQRSPLLGLHTRMKRTYMKTLSNSSLTRGKLMKKPPRL